MSVISYFPRVFSGLVDPKNKQARLERVSVASAESNCPVFVASYKNTAFFAHSNANGLSNTVLQPAGLQISRKHTALGRDAVLFTAIDPKQKKEQLYVSIVSKNSTVPISGYSGEASEIVVLNKHESANSVAIVVTSEHFFFLSSKDIAGAEKPSVTKVAATGALLSHVRACTAGGDDHTLVLHSTNEIQVWKFADDFSTASKVFEIRVGGIGIVFAKFANNHLYAVTDSGALLSRWSVGEDSKVLERKFDAPITSIYADKDYVILGHPKNLVEILEASDLTFMAAYTCSDDPDDVPKLTASKKDKGKSDLFQSFKDLVLNVDRYGDYIIGASDRSVCVWSIALKKLFNPIKLRETKGKIVSKLLIEKTSESVAVYAAVSRTNAESAGGKDDEDAAPAKIAPKDLRIDIMSWKIPAESLKKAEQRKMRDAEYLQTLSNLLSRDVANNLLQDVGFAHRVFHVSQSARYDSAFTKSLVDVSASIRRLPVYLTAAVDENLKELEGRKAIASAGFQMAGFSFPLPLSTFLLRRTSLNCSIICDFMLREGQSFIQTAWGPLFKKLRCASTEGWECNYRILYSAERKSGMTRETKRQLRREAKQKAQENTDKVIQWTQKYLDALFSAEKQIPEAIKEVLKYFFAKSREAITDELSDALIKNGPMELFFHDFLVPAAIAPSLLGMIDKVDYKLQMNLGQVGKLIDHIGLRKIGDEHPLAEYAQRAYIFICKLIGVDPERASSKKSKRQLVNVDVVHAKPKNIKPEKDNALMTQKYFNVSEFIINNASALSEANESDTFALEAGTSVMLQKLAKQDSIKLMKGKENCTVFCVPSADEDRHDGLEHDLKFFSGSFGIQEDLSSYRHGGLRSAAADDIPFGNLFAVDPRSCDSTREWLLEEAKHHSFLIVIFYRGAMCPFCSRYMRAWSKYMASVLKRDGLIVAISSQTQISAKKNVAEWQASYPSIGDPHNELATMFGVEIEQHPFFKHGMVQPAILALSRSGEALYFWKSAAALGSIMGATDRPRPYNVLESVFNELKKPKFSMSSNLVDTITRQSTIDTSSMNTESTTTASDK